LIDPSAAWMKVDFVLPFPQFGRLERGQKPDVILIVFALLFAGKGLDLTVSFTNSKLTLALCQLSK
jgi:hypothetical protein